MAYFGITTSVANIAYKYGTLLGANINRVDHNSYYARLVKSVDTEDLKSSDESCASSSLAPGTIFKNVKKIVAKNDE